MKASALISFIIVALGNAFVPPIQPTSKAITFYSSIIKESPLKVETSTSEASSSDDEPASSPHQGHVDRRTAITDSMSMILLAPFIASIAPHLFTDDDDVQVANDYASIRDSSSSIPYHQSKHLTVSSPGHPRYNYPPWNASPNIDDDGFLLHQYDRLPGDWENDFKFLRKQQISEVRTPSKVRQVPGDGNCLFNSISICYAHAIYGTHIDLRDVNNLRWLYMNSANLREKAVDCLEQKQKQLFLQGHEYIKTNDLVEAAASQFGISGSEYCQQMRQDHCWGGGPEIVALCNVLQRPIHIYELFVKNKRFTLRRMACFGSPKFDRNQALHILSADSRFPDLAPGEQIASGDHFLAMFPVEI